MKKVLKNAIQLLVVLMPWKIKRKLLQSYWKFNLHPKAHIGLSWIFPDYLEMKEGAKIGHFNVAIHLFNITLEKHATISRANWITGYPIKGLAHFKHQTNRMPALVLGAHSAVTKNHHLDCTDKITIGSFSTVAGYYSQLLTHSIDVNEGRQDSKPIEIGEYCFIGTNVVILGGSALPDRCVLGAKSLLNRKHTDTDCLYGGVSAQLIKRLEGQRKYFDRKVGFVD